MVEKEFEVHVRQVVCHVIKVHAEDEDQAEERALSYVNDCPNDYVVSEEEECDVVLIE